MSLETAVHRWQDGERTLREAPPDRRAVLEFVCEQILAELRRRLGGSFGSAELVDFYEAGTAWILPLAASLAPDSPWAWEATVGDAAFHRYLRDAHDCAGGRLER
ncbi:MAG TPA: hypothetical protein VG165_07225 [Solirubrobacteraceae bacterium]|nr:hypothetical protein [Solirubrobacteraceae bacterium]